MQPTQHDSTHIKPCKICPSAHLSIELKSYSQTIKLLKSLFVGSTTEALLTRQFIFRTVRHRRETKGRSAEHFKGAETALEWSLVTAICVAAAFKGSTFLGWRSGKKFGMMFVCCQLRGLAHCIWCPTPPAPSKRRPSAVQTARRNKMAFCKSFYKDIISWAVCFWHEETSLATREDF